MASNRQISIREILIFTALTAATLAAVRFGYVNSSPPLLTIGTPLGIGALVGAAMAFAIGGRKQVVDGAVVGAVALFLIYLACSPAVQSQTRKRPASLNSQNSPAPTAVSPIDSPALDATPPR